MWQVERFDGKVGRRQRSNLGGRRARGTDAQKSRKELLQSAHMQRVNLQQQRFRSEAALKIQRSFRAHRARRLLRERLRREFDQSKDPLQRARLAPFFAVGGDEARVDAVLAHWEHEPRADTVRQVQRLLCVRVKSIKNGTELLKKLNIALKTCSFGEWNAEDLFFNARRVVGTLTAQAQLIGVCALLFQLAKRTSLGREHLLAFILLTPNVMERLKESPLFASSKSLVLHAPRLPSLGASASVVQSNLRPVLADATLQTGSQFLATHAHVLWRIWHQHAKQSKNTHLAVTAFDKSPTWSTLALLACTLQCESLHYAHCLDSGVTNGHVARALPLALGTSVVSSVLRVALNYVVTTENAYRTRHVPVPLFRSVHRAPQQVQKRLEPPSVRPEEIRIVLGLCAFLQLYVHEAQSSSQLPLPADDILHVVRRLRDVARAVFVPRLVDPSNGHRVNSASSDQSSGHMSYQTSEQSGDQTGDHPVSHCVRLLRLCLARALTVTVNAPIASERTRARVRQMIESTFDDTLYDALQQRDAEAMADADHADDQDHDGGADDGKVGIRDTVPPVCIPRETRMRLLASRVRESHRAQLHDDAVHLRIHRDRLFADAHAQILRLNDIALKARWRVVFVDQFGRQEVGIDGGGLYKEFLAEFFERVFDPRHGLFRSTSNGDLYPSPAAYLGNVGNESTVEEHFELIGIVMGRALFDGVTMAARFSPSFLRLIINAVITGVTAFVMEDEDSESESEGESDEESEDSESDHYENDDDSDEESDDEDGDLKRATDMAVCLPAMLSELEAFDSALYRGLCALRDASPEQFGLILGDDAYFTAQVSELGVMREVPLCRGGAKRRVTHRNRLQYIMQLTQFRLRTQQEQQTRALVTGLLRVLPVRWLRLFSPDELQHLLCGHDDFDVAELRAAAHTNIVGDTARGSQVIQWFWDILFEMTAKERSQLLRFATSSPRAPLLGFDALRPRFAVAVNTNGDPDALPTAATCVNMLRLPPSHTRASLERALRQALEHATGFGLS